MRVLLVEDHPATARLIRENLAEGGHVASELRWVRTLAEARAVLLERAVDVVLLDLGLPDSDSLATLHALKDLTADVAIVVLTGLDDPDAALDALRNGADDYLVKSRANRDALASAIRYAAERKRAALNERRLLEMLQRVGEALTSQLSLEHVVRCVLDEGVARTHAGGGAVLWKPQGEPKERVLSSGVASLAVVRCIEATPVLRAAVEQRVLVHLADLGVERREVDGGALAFRSVIAAPILGRERDALGVLVLVHTLPHALDDWDARVAAGIASWAAVALENARLFEERDRAVRLRDDVLAVVSHDLRNPLAVIAQAAALLALASGERERARFEAHIKRAIERMNRLIGDLLDDAAIEKGTLRLQSRWRDPAALAREACASAGAPPIEHVVDERLPLIEADGDRVLQVLGNLIGNARKFSPPGALIVVSVERVDDGVRFSVRDSGPGIPKAEQERLFDRFYKGATSTTDGAGLGLAIARGIVDAHGGRLWVESDLGKGAVFRFTLPAREPAVAASTREEAERCQ